MRNKIEVLIGQLTLAQVWRCLCTKTSYLVMFINDQATSSQLFIVGPILICSLVARGSANLNSISTAPHKIKIQKKYLVMSSVAIFLFSVLIMFIIYIYYKFISYNIIILYNIIIIIIYDSVQ